MDKLVLFAAAAQLPIAGSRQSPLTSPHSVSFSKRYFRRVLRAVFHLMEEAIAGGEAVMIENTQSGKNCHIIGLRLRRCTETERWDAVNWAAAPSFQLGYCPPWNWGEVGLNGLLSSFWKKRQNVEKCFFFFVYFIDQIRNSRLPLCYHCHK